MRSGEILSATLESGETIEYVVDANAPRGGMKHTYFTPDKRYAVQFFNDPRNARDPQIHDRIRSIVSIYTGWEIFRGIVLNVDDGSRTVNKYTVCDFGNH